MHQAIGSFALLALLSVSYWTAVTRVERVRLAVTFGGAPNTANMWVFAAVPVLPLNMVLALVALLYVCEWPSRKHETKLYKHIYGGAALALSSAVADLMQAHMGSALWVLPAAFGAYYATDVALITAAITAERKPQVLRMFLVPQHHAFEVATAALGALLAAGMARHFEYGLLAVPGLLALHYSAVREALARSGSFEKETGLRSETRWKAEARQLLADTKKVGHLALVLIEPGEDVPAAMVMANLGGWVRPTDLAGYCGTQIAILMRVGRDGSGDVCVDGITASLAAASVPACVGRAVAPGGTALADLLISATSDLVLADALQRIAGPAL